MEAPPEAEPGLRPRATRLHPVCACGRGLQGHQRGGGWGQEGGTGQLWKGLRGGWGAAAAGAWEMRRGRGWVGRPECGRPGRGAGGVAGPGQCSQSRTGRWGAGGTPGPPAQLCRAGPEDAPSALGGSQSLLACKGHGHSSPSLPSLSDSAALCGPSQQEASLAPKLTPRPPPGKDWALDLGLHFFGGLPRGHWTHVGWGPRGGCPFCLNAGTWGCGVERGAVPRAPPHLRGRRAVLQQMLGSHRRFLSKGEPWSREAQWGSSRDLGQTQPTCRPVVWGVGRSPSPPPPFSARPGVLKQMLSQPSGVCPDGHTGSACQRPSQPGTAREEGTAEGAGWRALEVPGQPRLPSRDRGLVPRAGVLPAPFHPSSPSLSFPICSRVPAGSWPVCGLGAAWSCPPPAVGGEGRGGAGDGLSSTPTPRHAPQPITVTRLDDRWPGSVPGRTGSGQAPAPSPRERTAGGGGGTKTRGSGRGVSWKGPDVCGRAALAGCPARHEAGHRAFSWKRDGKLPYNICFSPTFASWLVQRPLPSRGLHLGPG